MSCLAVGPATNSDGIAACVVVCLSCRRLDRSEELTAGLQEQQEQCGGRLAFPCEDR